MNAEPSIVYRKNFTLAYTRRFEPQMPMTRNIGTSRASKNTKKSSRSSAQNEPRITVSSSKLRPMYMRTLWVTLHDEMSATGMMNVVSTTSQMLNPSTPTR